LLLLGELETKRAVSPRTPGKGKRKGGEKKIWPLISTVPYHMKGSDMPTAYLAV
jgi:hypothetical protein